MTVTVHLGGNALYAFRLAADGWALIDAGPAPASDPEAGWNELQAQLRAHDIETRAVRTVLITHAHADHAGLASRWAAAGARVLGGAGDIEALLTGAGAYESTRAARESELRRHGCPDAVLVAIARRPRAELAWPGCPDVEAAQDGDGFELADGRRLRVIEAPGHTRGNLVVAVEGPVGDAELCSGDTLLPETIPTPGLHFPEGPDGPRWPSLPAFVASVERLHGLAPGRLRPGHGVVVEGAEASRAVSARFLGHHARRAVRVRAALDGGARSAFEVARVLFPRLPAERLGQALTEVIGHFDLLVAAGDAALDESERGETVARLLGD